MENQMKDLIKHEGESSLNISNLQNEIRIANKLSTALNNGESEYNKKKKRN